MFSPNLNNLSNSHALRLKPEYYPNKELYKKKLNLGHHTFGKQVDRKELFEENEAPSFYRYTDNA